MIVLEIQMAPELGELFARVVGGVLRRLDEGLPRPLFVPDDPEMAVFWSEDLRCQLREDAQRLRDLFLHPHFGSDELSIPEAEAEALCRAASAVRLALRELELAQLADHDLESGLVQPPELDEPLRRAYYCYWFLGGLQEMIVRALDPSLDPPADSAGEDPGLN
jgi:hypothetical protein